mmetsp:Transcript_50172/g.127692  ORF Transcript_50172/g.127692 Transcript_50172/m.127692 type:complete len:424 (-) Transcript_50172:35-1306(-)
MVGCREEYGPHARASELRRLRKAAEAAGGSDGLHDELLLPLQDLLQLGAQWGVHDLLDAARRLGMVLSHLCGEVHGVRQQLLKLADCAHQAQANGVVGREPIAAQHQLLGLAHANQKRDHHGRPQLRGQAELGEGPHEARIAGAEDDITKVRQSDVCTSADGDAVNGHDQGLREIPEGLGLGREHDVAHRRHAALPVGINHLRGDVDVLVALERGAGVEGPRPGARPDEGPDARVAPRVLEHEEGLHLLIGREAVQGFGCVEGSDGDTHIFQQTPGDVPQLVRTRCFALGVEVHRNAAVLGQALRGQVRRQQRPVHRRHLRLRRRLRRRREPGHQRTSAGRHLGRCRRGRSTADPTRGALGVDDVHARRDGGGGLGRNRPQLRPWAANRHGIRRRRVALRHPRHPCGCSRRGVRAGDADQAGR